MSRALRLISGWLSSSVSTLGCGPIADSVAAAACAEPTLEIGEIQGTGPVSPRLDQSVRIQGIVSLAPAGLGSHVGFYLQAARSDRDPRSSDAVFVALDGGTASGPTAGERLRVQGRVEEIAGVTALSSVELLQPCGYAPLSPSSLELGRDDDTAERWEGMWIRSDQTWTLVDTSELSSHGQLGVSPWGRPYAAGHPLGQSSSERAQVPWTLEGMAEAARSWISAGVASDHLRLGAQARGLTGVVVSTSPPTLLATAPVDFRSTPATPLQQPAPGSLRVAALNLDNYFVELGARGARTELELSRQRTKLVAALRQLDADILALSELQSQTASAGGPARDSASLSDLIAALDRGTPNELAYRVSDAAADGSDVLRSAIAYRPSRVSASGPARFATGSEFRRAPLFQTFEARGRAFTLGVVHLKSKLCNGAQQIVGSEGCGAAVRRAEARALAALIAALPASQARDLLLIGDFNSDAAEEPLLELQRTGLTDLFDGVASRDRYSYVFEGHATQLDHALATASLSRALTNAQIWHVNADEPELLGYGLEHPPEAYQPDARRSSDHDPILVDFAL